MCSIAHSMFSERRPNCLHCCAGASSEQQECKKLDSKGAFLICVVTLRKRCSEACMNVGAQASAAAARGAVSAHPRASLYTSTLAIPWLFHVKSGGLEAHIDELHPVRRQQPLSRLQLRREQRHQNTILLRSRPGYSRCATVHKPALCRAS